MRKINMQRGEGVFIKAEPFHQTAAYTAALIFDLIESGLQVMGVYTGQ